MRLLDLHRTLLADHSAQEAYRQAISRSVRPGDVVLDLGTGSGIHALFACRAGARKIYAVDQHEFIEVARRVCQANGCSDRIEFLHGPAAEVRVPEPADVVIGHHGLRELFELFPLARERFLRPGGILIPMRIEFFCAPLDSPAAHDRVVSFWEQERFGLSFSPVSTYAINQAHDWQVQPGEQLGNQTSLGSLDLGTVQDASFCGTGQTTVTRAGTLHGLGFWITQWLTSEISVSTAPPCSVSPDIWGHEFLPIKTPLPVAVGDTVEMRLHAGSGGWGKLWKWEVEVRASGTSAPVRFVHSNFFDSLLSKEALRKQTGDYQPRLTARGDVVRFVLESCDGKQSLRWIEEEVVKRFPDAFITPSEAAGLVAGLLSKYTR